MAVAFGKESVAFLIDAVPVVAPRTTDVAAPPTLSVVALVLKMFAVVAVVVSEPPLSLILPAVVISPVEPVIEKLVPRIFPVPTDKALVILPPERSIPVVIPPPEDEIVKPTGRL